MDLRKRFKEKKAETIELSKTMALLLGSVISTGAAAPQPRSRWDTCERGVSSVNIHR